jgi:hypothetical protein
MYRAVRPASSRSMARFPYGLGDPGGAGMGGGAHDADAAAGVLDHREDVHAGPGERDHLEEVGGEDGVGLGA